MSSGPRYLSQKPIIHSRDSSADSRTYESPRSTYTSNLTSSATMADARPRDERTRINRVPDNPSHRITTTTSRSGKNLVIDHRLGHYDRQEPRASDAQYKDYRRTQDRTQYYSGSSGSSTTG